MQQDGLRRVGLGSERAANATGVGLIGCAGFSPQSSAVAQLVQCLVCRVTGVRTPRDYTGPQTDPGGPEPSLERRLQGASLENTVLSAVH